MALITLLALSGCMTLARTKGAKTLEPGQVELAVLGPAVRRGDDPNQKLPIPVGGGVELRVGVGDNVDIGFQGYVIGLGFDVRYRFFHRGRLHLAVAPGVGLITQPWQENLGLGGFEGKMPLIGEVELTKWLGLSAGPQVVMRESWYPGLDGGVWRFDLYAGGGMRAEAHGGLFAIGLAFDVLYAPTQFSGAPLYVAGLDLKFRSRTRAEANARRARRGRPLRWPEADTDRGVE